MEQARAAAQAARRKKTEDALGAQDRARSSGQSAELRKGNDVASPELRKSAASPRREPRNPLGAEIRRGADRYLEASRPQLVHPIGLELGSGLIRP